eukprot:CAMPEP_0194054602 /NCGR_PEP_ID=MMETSP0009_2-20130614/53925_1 /TAXON_ID=210454 /ORGANISM="Grammatophora oceanica, Strain CCMP 410" /LENGTH=378 /DNA_ID=CAMNT_0038703155 /DNA_START=94 /DNA_END=1230 /DNA_ORIENTATION=+
MALAISASQLLTPVSALSSSGENICGWTITEDKKMTADSVCQCDRDEPAVTLRGGATLDMDGYKIRCLGSEKAEACIYVSGTGATVKDGTVDNCEIGIHSAGGGEHTVLGMKVTNAMVGILVRDDSDDVVLSGNKVDSPDKHGIVIEGDNVLVSDNEVDSAISVGIYIEVEADDAVVRGNAVLNSGEDGIYVDGDTTLVESNAISDSGMNGIQVDNGSEDAQLVRNTIKSSGAAGVYANEDNILIEENEITGASHLSAIVASGDDVMIIGNKVKDFQDDGIVLSGSNGFIEANNVISLVRFADGIVVGTYGDSTISLVANMIAGNTVVAEDAIVMKSEGDNTITNNHITGDTLDYACGNNNWEDDNTYVNGRHSVACA